jgi:hypothetical protein
VVSEDQDGAVCIEVGDARDTVPLGEARVEDLERGVLTAAIDLRAVRLLVWSFHVSEDGREFSSPEARTMWKWLLAFSPGHHRTPTREQVRQAFPGFRFVRPRYPLLDMAARMFKKPRTFAAPVPVDTDLWRRR